MNSTQPQRQEVSKLLKNACQQALVSLVRIFYRIGIGPQQFNELARRAYVDMLNEDARIEGKRPSKSRIAMLMGVKRDVVSKIKATEDEVEIVIASTPSQVLGRWRVEAKWKDSNGEPRTLTLNEFKELCRSVDGRYPHSTIAEELLASKCIKVSSRNWFELTNANYSFVNDLDQSISGMLWRVSAHFRTMAHNINALSGKAEDQYWLDRVIHSKYIPDHKLESLRKNAPAVIHDSLKSFQSFIDPHEKVDDVELNSVVIGVYYAEIPIDQKTPR